MITVAQAKKKIQQVHPNTPIAVERLFMDVLDRKKLLSKKESFLESDAKEWVMWIENRLAQPHLGFLEPSQVNGIWGGSTTDAIDACAKKFGFAVDRKNPVIGSDILRSILDGSKAKEEVISSTPNSYEWLKQQLLKRKYAWDDKPLCFNVIGIRGYMLAKGEVPNIGDLYNDTIFLAWVDEYGNKRCEPYAASVDAGYYYYSVAPLFARGCAHLLPGQYKYQIGTHIDYMAGVQDSSVKIARSNTANYDLTKCPVDEGWFGINIHSGYDFGQGSVWNSSAGCQVIQSAGPQGWQWQKFISCLKKDLDWKFYYTLFDGKTM